MTPRATLFVVIAFSVAVCLAPTALAGPEDVIEETLEQVVGPEPEPCRPTCDLDLDEGPDPSGCRPYCDGIF